jgi:2-C-methyl-D-erythritol 4-phosphate cytidylyltransferase/2-C-methyl-D-erythritol 2,4-cyclodiphosphate synthase
VSATEGTTPAPWDALVVAAGRSSRMGGRDKLLATVAGRPLLSWTLARLAAAPGLERIVLVVAHERLAELQRADWLPPLVAAVVAGGGRRQESVAAGLAALDELDGWREVDEEGRARLARRVVLIHDGARPLVRPSLAAAVAQAAEQWGAAVPVLPVHETVKRVEDGWVAATVEREGLALAQTPQGARRGLLREAFRRFPPEGEPTWTDEAALLEGCRIPVRAIPGDPDNLKVTVPDDLARVHAALQGGVAVRSGIGQDRHPFGPGSPLVLAGVAIPAAPRLHGHSDGDVALHAVADALLGAAGLGDLGRLFPPGPSTPRGIASSLLLAEVVRRLAETGWRPRSVDLTIVAGRPALGPYLEVMRQRLADLLGLHLDRVSVKASSGNLGGDEGAGRAISALAVALIEPAP